MIQDFQEQPIIERSSLKTGTFIDLATSTQTRADFTVIATCGLDEKENIYILNILRGRWEWPDARERIIEEILLQEVGLAMELESRLSTRIQSA